MTAAALDRDAAAASSVDESVNTDAGASDDLDLSQWMHRHHHHHHQQQQQQRLMTSVESCAAALARYLPTHPTPYSLSARNDLRCVEWDVKPCSTNQPSLVSQLN